MLDAKVKNAGNGIFILVLKRVRSGDVDVFMQLQGKLPDGICQDIFRDQRGDLLVFAPFGLQEAFALRGHQGGIFFRPGKIGRMIDDHFQFMSPEQDFRKG